ncbi:hypothetical protein C474_20241 [Halogeometricum pallidum JCM 14848]|uniref:Uncharacterized protein n=1 Tax=Halogeometricum pallidum JCM 14848 TaxID=1227487 RepID=M0CUJ3_HALPD|nr:hypothetical protein [Halogeometricum pallidum]ELZ26067.1 hypothetical protein C474_20241 [Halogeometricum pallidum JCM 14848]
MSSLDSDIDALARRIEREIRRNETRLAALPEFSGEWQRGATASIPDADDLFF